MNIFSICFECIGKNILPLGVLEFSWVREPTLFYTKRQVSVSINYWKHLLKFINAYKDPVY